VSDGWIKRPATIARLLTEAERHQNQMIAFLSDATTLANRSGEADVSERLDRIAVDAWNALNALVELREQRGKQ